MAADLIGFSLVGGRGEVGGEKWEDERRWRVEDVIIYDMTLW